MRAKSVIVGNLLTGTTGADGLVGCVIVLEVDKENGMWCGMVQGKVP